MAEIVILPQKQSERPVRPPVSVDQYRSETMPRFCPANDCSRRASWRRRLVHALAFMLPLAIIKAMLHRAPGEKHDR